MTIKIGDKLPAGEVQEYIEEETEGCVIGPNKFKVEDLVKGKTIALFALPGAYTPGCSKTHLPGFIKLADQFKAKGVDEIWCLAVNDAFVMGAWSRDQGAGGKVRLLADGSGDYTKKLGLELDLTAGGLGMRSQRYSALIKDGVVTQLNLEGGGGINVSTAEKLLEQI